MVFDKDDMYNINNYTDKEIYDILDLINPSDRELEAKINLMMFKYDNNNSEANVLLYNFFNDIYSHFFESGYITEDYTDEIFSPQKYANNFESDIIVEGMDSISSISQPSLSQPFPPTIPESSTAIISSTTDQTKQLQYLQSQIQELQQQLKIYQTVKDESNNAIPKTPPVSLVNSVNYTKDYLNPLLKQTYKRIISIDSQYRNKTVFPKSTDFTFNLSDILKNVLSVKLYSIQIPYNWWTINADFGGNFFYLKGVSNGINNRKHDYQITIDAGNYTAIALQTAINNSFTKTSTLYTDCSFGNTTLNYNPISCLSSLDIDITKIYNESVYETEFLNKKYYDFSGNSVDIKGISNRNYDSSKNFYDLSSFLGFDTIKLNSNYYLSNKIVYDLSNTPFELNSVNNSITIIQYHNIDETVFNYSHIDSIIDYSFNIVLSLPIGNYTTNELMNNLNTKLSTNINLIDSKIEKYTINSYDSVNNKNISYDVFKLTIKLNRYIKPNLINSKYAIIFPFVDNTIWKGFTSMFNFTDVSNNIFTMNNILGTNPIIETDFNIEDFPFIKFVCNKPNYDASYNNSNNYKINIPNTTTSILLTQYLQNINNSVFNEITKQDLSNNIVSNFTNTMITITQDNIINYKIDFIKTFNQSSYYLDLSNNNILKTISFNNISQNGTTLSGDNLLNINLATDRLTLDISNSIQFKIPFSGNYYIDITKPLFVMKSKTNSGHKISVGLISNNVNSRTDNPFYTSINDFVVDVTTSLKTYLDGSFNYPFINSTTKLINNILDFTFTITFNITDSLYITDYDILFDSSSNITINNSWKTNLDLSYNYNMKTLYLTDTSYNSYNKPTYTIIGEKIEPYDFNLSSTNGKFKIQPIVDLSGGAYTDNDNNNENAINIQIYSVDKNGISLDKYYADTTNSNSRNKLSQYEVVTQINNQLSKNPIFKGSSLILTIINDLNYYYFNLNINKVFTASDYSLVLFDPSIFTKCVSKNSSIINVTVDQTMGWILGFRNNIEYFLDNSEGNISSIYKNKNIKSIFGDTTIAINLYNYFLIQLNDFSQSHINDGLVTVSKQEQNIALPSYVNNNNINCDQFGNQTFGGDNAPSQNSADFNKLTQAQIYSANQVLNARKSQIHTFSQGPSVQDIFAIVPIKPGIAGQTYVEFGGPLQNQDRTYFGPVNLSKFSVQLLTDRGGLLNLNNADWGFSLLCEQMYKI